MPESIQQLSNGPQNREGSAEFVNLDDFWLKERKEGEPKIKFKVALGLHAGSKDIEFFREDFKSCDIYIPEVVSWKNESKSIWNAISRGSLKAEQYIKDYKQRHPDWRKREYHFAQMRMIEKSRKPITFIDLPADHQLTDTAGKIISRVNDNLEKATNLNQKTAAMREFLIAFSEVIKAREMIMFQEIPGAIRKIIDNSPELRKKTELKVLISLGAAHTPFYIMLKSVDQTVERSFPEIPQIFGHFDRLIRMLSFGKSIKDITDEEIGRAVLDGDFFKIFDKSRKQASETTGAAVFAKKARKYIDMFNSQEIREFYEEVGKGRKFRDVFLEFLKGKGVEDKSL